LTLALSAVASMVQAPPPSFERAIAGWSIDSRTLAPGDLFIALRGEIHDGHDYVGPALARGAAAALVSRPFEGPVLQVADTQRALEDLGRQVRRRWGGTIVGVTGSAGKTSTKDIIAALLSVAIPTGRTIGNLNNHIGVPLSILRLPDDCRVAVLEMGMNHAGEIAHLASIAGPDIGVVTNVGYAHIEHFAEGVEGIAAAKRELVEGLPASGVAVLNHDDPRVRAMARGRTVTFGLSEGADVRAEDVKLTPGGARFRVGGVSFETSLPGHHGIRNILAGVAVAGELGIAPERLTAVVREILPGKMRGERFTRNGVEIINDCYNANPDAVNAMLGVLRDSPARRRIAVLGEMRELGTWSEELHREMGRSAARHGVDLLVGVRGDARFAVEEAGAGAVFFDEPAAAGAHLRRVAQAGDLVLFKGSRGTRVELALEAFLAGGAAR
jgi:UDP-N-acetylmuramoyl-tripeptide--D-alanyl-D-alanine ligase